MTSHLVLHLAGSGTAPFPDLSGHCRTARNAPDGTSPAPGSKWSSKALRPPVDRGHGVGRGDGQPSSRTVYPSRPAATACALPESMNLRWHPAVKVVPAAVAHLTTVSFDGTAYIRV